MTDEEIIDRLREASSSLRAAQLAGLLEELTAGGLSQGSLITYFKRAFPKIPLRVLIEAGAWARVSDGGLTDDEFDDLLGEWLPSGIRAGADGD